VGSRRGHKRQGVTWSPLSWCLALRLAHALGVAGDGDITAAVAMLLELSEESQGVAAPRIPAFEEIGCIGREETAAAVTARLALGKRGGGTVNLLHVNVIIWQGDTRLPHSRCLRCGWKTGDLPPGVKSLAHLLAIHGGRQPMSPWTEVLGNRTIRGQKSLGVPGGLEPLHASLLLAPGLVGVFRTIVEVAMLPMLHARQHLPLRSPIALQLIRDNDAGHVG
jgi:hypothetical protein